MIFLCEIGAGVTALKSGFDLMSVECENPELFVTEDSIRIQATSSTKTTYVIMSIDRHNTSRFETNPDLFNNRMGDEPVHHLSLHSPRTSAAMKSVKKQKQFVMTEKQLEPGKLFIRTGSDAGWCHIDTSDRREVFSVPEHEQIPSEMPNIVIPLHQIKSFFSSTPRGSRTGSITITSSSLAALLQGSSGVESRNSWGIDGGGERKDYALKETHIRTLSKMSSLNSDGQARFYCNVKSDTITSLRIEVSLVFGTWYMYLM